MKSPAVKSAYLGWLAAAIAGERGASSTFAADEQDLVLGYATGYDVADIAIFVRSLRAHYSGPVALVVDPDPGLRGFLNRYRIEALDVPVIHDGATDWAPHAVVSRFAGYDQLLRDRPWVRNALLTDVRDVVFQADPFEQDLKGLEFFVEADTPLASHDFNMKYLRAVAGDAMAEQVSGQACICVGTVMGPREALMRFCRLILMLGAIPRSQIGGAFGADQATCNLAVHMGLLEGTVRGNHSRVATLGMVARDRITLEDGNILNPDKSLSAVVHQYDRHPDLMDAMWRKWSSDLEVRVRCRPRTLEGRIARLKDSLGRRCAELR